jgi:hypothetical protein
MPGDWRAPIVTSYDEALVTQRSRKPSNIVAQLNDVVGFDRGGLVAPAIPALVGNGDLEASFYQRVDLMAPKVPALRKAMEEDHKRPTALDDGAERDAVGFDHLEIALFHVILVNFNFAALARDAKDQQ